MQIHTCNVVPRFKFMLFQLFLKSVRVLLLVLVGLRLLPVYGNLLPCNYLVFPNIFPRISSALAFNSPICFPVLLVQGDDFSAIKKSHLFAIWETCSSSLPIHQTTLFKKNKYKPCCCKRECRLVLQPLNIAIPSVPAADLFNYV